MKRYLFSFVLAASLNLLATSSNAAEISELRYTQTTNHNDDKVAIVLGFLLISGVIISASSNKIHQQYNRWLVVKRINQIIALERALQKASCDSH